MGRKVGIDFGTSNSGAAVYAAGKIHLLPLDPRNVVPEVVKSIMYITKDFRHTIGQEAVELYYKHNVNRLRHYEKKWVGEIDVYGGDMHYVRDIYTYVDVLKPGRLLQFIKTALRSEGYDGTQVFERYYRVVDIVSAYLRELKQRTEALLGEPVSGVTLGRPVQFSPDPELDRKAQETLRQAAHEAGFDEVDFEFEPVAAALFYEKTLDRPQNALIFDFGGGTLDITILRLGDPHHRDVYAMGGIGLAGSDFDRTIIEKRLLPHFGWGQADFSPLVQELIHAVSDWIALPELSTPQARLQLERAIMAQQAPARVRALQALIFNDLAFSFYNRVEAVKIALSEQGAAVVRLSDKDIDLWELYTRHQFEADIRSQRAQIEKVLLDTVIASGLEPEQIDAVVKTGGSSNVPVFSEMLESVFGPERVKVSALFSSVVGGLAIRAAEGR